MPARITEGYLRVTFPGFDRKLPTWRGQKIKDLNADQQEKLVWTFNEMILSGNYDAVKMWFPKERTKTFVKKVIWSWLEHKYKRPGTLLKQENEIKRYIIPQIGDKSIKELIRQDFYWIRQRWGDTSMAREVSRTCQALMTWCWREGMIDKPIYLPSITVPKKPTPYIEIADRWLIHSKVESRYQKPIAVAIEMGMRIGEIVALKPDALDLNRNQLRVIRALSGRQIIDMRKGGDEVWLPLDMPYIEHSKVIFTDRDLTNEWIFPAIRGSFIWPNYISQAFKQAAREIGLPHATLHQCRHSFAQDRRSEGYSLEETQALLGHKSRATTERYQGVGIRRLNRVREMR